MTSIRDIPDFYERLHALEKYVSIFDSEGNLIQVRPGLKHVDDTDPELLRLRRDLGAKVTKKPIYSRVNSAEVDWDTMLKRMKGLSYSRKDMAKKLGFAQSTWSKKYQDSTFTEMEIRRIEKILNLKTGKLYPLQGSKKNMHYNERELTIN